MSLGHAILGFLNRSPMTGYDLKTRCFDETASHFWAADQAQIYRTLERLEAKGLLTSDIEVQHGRPDRRVYEVTDAGREALKDWLAQPRELPAVRDPLLVQLFFSGELPDQDILSLLTAARREHRERLDIMRKQLAKESTRLHHNASQKRDSAVRGFTLQAELARERAAVDWLDDCIESVRTGLPGGPGRSKQLMEH
jgi:DNA-binding PadR family transcriptional regulator